MAQKQVQDAYIVAATRTPIGRSGRGYFKNTRPDDLLVAAVKSAMLQVPTLDPKAIEDAIIGCSFPEGEQGMNMARIAMGLAFDHPVGGVTVNRFCASGITALQMAADRIRVGEADVLIAGGAESMSLVPMGGNKPSFNAEIFAKDENVGIAYGMGLTAEKVAQQWKVSREMQDAFALESHLRAIKAQKAGGRFDTQVLIEAEQLTREQDMPDEARAKLHLAIGRALVADLPEDNLTGTEADQLETARANIARAIELHGSCGGKKDLERVQRLLKKHADSKPAETGNGEPPANDQQPSEQDESQSSEEGTEAETDTGAPSAN